MDDAAWSIVAGAVEALKAIALSGVVVGAFEYAHRDAKQSGETWRVSLTRAVLIGPIFAAALFLLVASVWVWLDQPLKVAAFCLVLVVIPMVAGGRQGDRDHFQEWRRDVDTGRVTLRRGANPFSRRGQRRIAREERQAAKDERVVGSGRE